MALTRAQLVMPHTLGLPEDVATNTLHFTTTSNPPSTAELNSIRDSIINMFVTIPTGGTVALQSFLSTEVAQNGWKIKYYDLADLEPRAPLREDTFNLTVAPNGDPLPGEVALCLSFQGIKTSGEAQSRRRGRIYIGRLDKDSSVSGRPSDLLRTTLALVGDKLLADSAAAVDWAWVIYSPTQDLAGDPTPFTLVDNGWVDNAFDTLRSRGVAPTARSLFS